ncbi:MAG: PLP-dependent aminotransferase family protein, partial [Oscillospiraceae bacterium]|nr:PLP-dependent aminotransferase family protein [Oscillospiraceae bacterium]
KSSELERTEATVLHITPFNSFPSGITAGVSKRHEYLRWAEKKCGYIIEDNYAAELTVSKKNEDTVFSLSPQNSVIYLNTFSETIAPSMRIGYMVLPEILARSFEEKLGFYSCTVPVFEQYVLAELINSGDFERHINRVRRAKRKAK